MTNALAILKMLEGKRTYLVVMIGCVLLFGSWQSWWVIPPQVYTGLVLLMGAFLRAGFAREIKGLETGKDDTDGLTKTGGAEVTEKFAALPSLQQPTE